METALKNQIVATFDELYLKTMQNEYTGFANVSTLDLLNHLFQRYGRVTPEDTHKNDERLKQSWDVTQPFEHLVEQIEEAVTYADAAREPYTNAHFFSSTPSRSTHGSIQPGVQGLATTTSGSHHIATV